MANDKKKEVRFVIDAELLLRLRIICTKLELSLPMQMNALIKNFVEIQEENLKKLGK